MIRRCFLKLLFHKCSVLLGLCFSEVSASLIFYFSKSSG